MYCGHSTAAMVVDRGRGIGVASDSAYGLVIIYYLWYFVLHTVVSDTVI